MIQKTKKTKMFAHIFPIRWFILLHFFILPSFCFHFLSYKFINFGNSINCLECSRFAFIPLCACYSGWCDPFQLKVLINNHHYELIIICSFFSILCPILILPFFCCFTFWMEWMSWELGVSWKGWGVLLLESYLLFVTSLESDLLK